MAKKQKRLPQREFDKLIGVIDDLESNVAGINIKASLETLFENAFFFTDYALRVPEKEGSPFTDLLNVVAYIPGKGDQELLRTGVYFKSTATAIQKGDVPAVIQSLNDNSLERLIVATTVGFDEDAVSDARSFHPVKIDVMDLPRMRSWLISLGPKQKDDKQTDAFYSKVVAALSMQLAFEIARNSRMLWKVEWRQLEHLLGEVFRGLGFDVTVTRISKDGGKDLVVHCDVRGTTRTFYIEVKHWKETSRPGSAVVREFVDVLLKDKIEKGLVLSSTGFTADAFEGLTEIERERVRGGSTDKVIKLCRTYVRAKSGLWSPPSDLVDVIFDGTIVPPTVVEANEKTPHADHRTRR